MTERPPSPLPSILSGLLPVAALLILLPALDLTLRTLAMAAIAVGGAATADALRNRETMGGAILRFLSALAAAACLGATQYLLGALTGYFAGPVHALLAALVGIAVQNALHPTPWLDALLVLFSLPLLALHATAGRLDLLPWLTVALLALVLRFRRHGGSRRPLLAALFLVPLLITPLAVGINGLTQSGLTVLKTDDFAVFTDPLAGTGGCPLPVNLPGSGELNPLPGDQWTLALPGSGGQTIPGRATLFSPGLAGSLVLSETSSPLVRPHFLPDLLRFYPGRSVLPWTERDRLEIRLSRGLLGMWQVQGIEVRGYRFQLLPDPVSGNGWSHTLAGGPDGLAILEAGLETGSIQLLTLTPAVQLLRTSIIGFDPSGIRWCGGPLVFGNETDHLAGSRIPLVAFFRPDGQFDHGLRGAGPIHEILPLADQQLIMFHGPFIQRLRRSGETLALVERPSDGPVIATASPDGTVHFIDFLEGTLNRWDSREAVIIPLGRSRGNLLAASGCGTWHGGFGDTEIRCLETGQTREIEMAVHWLAGIGMNLWIGLQDGRAQRLLADQTLAAPLIWPGKIPPLDLGGTMLTRQGRDLILLAADGEVNRQFSGATIDTSAPDPDHLSGR